MVDPKTKRRINLEDLEEKNLHKVCYDSVFIKNFIKEEMEEILKSEKGKHWLTRQPDHSVLLRIPSIH